MQRALIFCFAVALNLLPTHAEGAATTTVGALAPIFVVPAIDGQDVNLSLLRGKVVLINFWASWCPPCRREQPMLSKIYRRYHTQGLEMVGVSQDAASERARVVQLQHDVPYPLAMADEARVNDFREPDTLPASFLVGRDGILRRVFTNEVAELSEHDVDVALAPLLRQVWPEADPRPSHPAARQGAHSVPHP